MLTIEFCSVYWKKTTSEAEDDRLITIYNDIITIHVKFYYKKKLAGSFDRNNDYRSLTDHNFNRNLNLKSISYTALKELISCPNGYF